MTGDIADDDGRDDRSLANAVDAVEEKKREDHGGCHHADVYDDFYTSCFLAGDFMQGSGKAFSRQHDYICGKFHGYAEGKNQTADQKTDDLHQVLLRVQPEDQVFHGKVDEVSEQNGYRNLEQLNRLVVFAEKKDLKGNEQEAEQDCKTAEGQRVLQAEHVWDTGNR